MKKRTVTQWLFDAAFWITLAGLALIFVYGLSVSWHDYLQRDLRARLDALERWREETRPCWVERNALDAEPVVELPEGRRVR